MGTVPMLCPYKMMFSGLIPYLGEERAGQRPAPASRRQEIQPRASPCSGHSALRGSLGCGGGLCPRCLCLAPRDWAQRSSWLEQRTARAELLDDPGGGHGSPLPGAGLRGQFTAPCSWGTVQARPGYRQGRARHGASP